MKLTITDIESILDQYKSGTSIIALSHAYKVSYEHIRRVVKGERCTKKIQAIQDRKTHERVLESVIEFNQSKD